LKEASSIVNSKKSYYEACIRNGFFLPSFKSSLITMEYLIAVREKRILCPMHAEIRLRPCPVPPLKELILGEILKCEQIMGFNIGLSKPEDAWLVDSEWLVALLSTMNPDHRFFRKDYKPSPEESRQRTNPLEDACISNADNFFTDLP
jgi:hypothetical protein